MITTELVTDIIGAFFDRCQAARSAGGIPYTDVVEGKPVPDGWRLDHLTEYFLPPNVTLFPSKGIGFTIPS